MSFLQQAGANIDQVKSLPASSHWPGAESKAKYCWHTAARIKLLLLTLIGWCWQLEGQCLVWTVAFVMIFHQTHACFSVLCKTTCSSLSLTQWTGRASLCATYPWWRLCESFPFISPFAACVAMMEIMWVISLHITLCCMCSRDGNYVSHFPSYHPLLHVLPWWRPCVISLHVTLCCIAMMESFPFMSPFAV